MKKLIVASMALALAACNGAGSDADEASADQASADETGVAEGETAGAGDVLTGDAPGFEAVAPGTYQVTRAGGEVDFIEIHPGMTYSRVDADGVATGGSIFMRDGMTCFTVEGAEGENCFTDGPRQEDGSMETISEEGRVSTVQPVEGQLEDHVGSE